LPVRFQKIFKIGFVLDDEALGAQFGQLVAEVVYFAARRFKCGFYPAHRHLLKKSPALRRDRNDVVCQAS
jgi:hypothetical protein